MYYFQTWNKNKPYINWYKDHHTLHLIGFYSKIWVINATFHNMSVILRWSVAWVRETYIPARLWGALSYKVKWEHHVTGELWVFSGDLYRGNNISNQNTNTTSLQLVVIKTYIHIPSSTCCRHNSTFNII